jgi:hypothetical protein
VEAVEDLFFVDAQASVSQQVLDSRAAASTANERTVQVYRISPYLQHCFGGFAEAEARYRLSQVFADDEARAAKLTARGRDYADDALCMKIEESCTWRSISYDAFAASLANVDEKHADLIYTYGVASLAYIRANSSDWNALTQIPQATAIMQRYIAMRGATAKPSAHSYLGILMTFRGEMGGQMDQGRVQFEQAITLSDNRDLNAKLELLKGYARARYDRELNDKLCGEILNATPYADGYTLTNVMAQEEALVLCAEADDYF